MQKFNIINYIHIVDLSLLNFIDYLDVIEDSYHVTEDNNQLFLNLNTKNKKILTGFIINNINNNIQYGKTNILINTCKPMQNWRQEVRGNALRAYKYKFIDNSITVDIIKFNQFIDSLFNKLPKLNLRNISQAYLGENDVLKFTFQQNLFCLDLENLDSCDAVNVLHKLLTHLGHIDCQTLNYNNLLLIDGNYDYAHSSSCPDGIIESVRHNLIKKGII
jgi:hypothetical protein